MFPLPFVSHFPFGFCGDSPSKSACFQAFRRLQGVLPAEILHRRAGLALEEGAEARRRAEAHLFGYFGHGDVRFAEEALCVFDDPVVDCVQHRESRFALEVLGEVGMRCAARLRDALDGELPRVRRTDEVKRRCDMRIRRRAASSSGVVAVGGRREILTSIVLSDGGTSSRAPRRTGIPSPGL